VRILLGDPDSQVVTDRGEDEGVGDAMAAKIRNALALYRPLRAAGGVESLVQAAVRETREETGVESEVTGLVGVYSDPRHVMLYTSNGEVRQEFSIVLTARAVGGEPTPSEESSEVRWVPRGEFGGYSMDRSMRLRIGHYLKGRAAPYLG
jgi:8-oxo-dGTP pyrophosphatase MutT (NUDIX family)